MTEYRWAGYSFFLLFLATVLVANWLAAKVGIIGVGFGLRAPAGVLAAGLAFTFRDLLQDQLGRLWVVVAIMVGAGLSALFSPQFALASGVAFLLSEVADFAVYTPLRQRGHRLVGVLVSNVVGLVLDSALFLWLAFQSLEFLPGQVVAKLYMTIAAVGVLVVMPRTTPSPHQAGLRLQG
jgi:uncharacterized PurR-regulated membrane protein YhhQ (DUF165 family)